MENKNHIKIKEIDLKSKFFFAPINTGLALNGNPTDELISFHSLRSNEYTGINYVGNVAIDIENITNKNTLFINSSMDKYCTLASEIRKKGSVAGVQIACFKSKFQAQRNWTNALPNDYIEFVKTEINNLSLSNIKEVIKSFQNGIRKLVEMGFEVIQIHGAHGYFLNNFLSETFNSRSDEFGKDRTLILKEILYGIDSLLSQIIIDLRISVFEESFESELTAKQFSFLESIYKVAGIDIISVSNGIYNLDKKLIYPVKTKGVSFMLEILANFIKTHNEKIWNLSGNVRNIAELIELNSGITFSIGRSIIADQDFLKKHFENRAQEIVECKFKNQCHYFSLQKEFIECGVNKQLY